MSTKGGAYSQMRGWLGPVFSDRYHAHPLKTQTEMANAARYVLNNAEHHYGPRDTRVDAFSSAVAPDVVNDAKGFLLARVCKRVLASTT